MIRCTQPTRIPRVLHSMRNGRSWPRAFYRNSVDTCTVACTIARAVVTGGHGRKPEEMCTSLPEARPLQAVTLVPGAIFIHNE